MKMLGSQPLPYLDANPESSFRPQPQLALYRPHFLLPQIDLLISTVLSILCACPSLMFLDVVKLHGLYLPVSLSELPILAFVI